MKLIQTQSNVQYLINEKAKTIERITLIFIPNNSRSKPFSSSPGTVRQYVSITPSVINEILMVNYKGLGFFTTTPITSITYI